MAGAVAGACDLDLLEPLAFPFPLARIVGQHHERQDGSGYPRGLKGEDILLEARVIAVADVVEAMIPPAPNGPPWAWRRPCKR